MNEQDEYRIYAVHLRDEHRRLHAAVEEIETFLSDSIAAGQLGKDWHIRMVARLHGLRADLVHHFREEEQGGCLEEAVSRCPRLSADVRQIEREHVELLEQLDQLAGDARTAPPSSVQCAFDRIAQRIRAHERLENQLIREAFNVTE